MKSSIFIFIVLLSSILSSCDLRPTYELSGSISEELSGNPVSGATVYLIGVGFGTPTVYAKTVSNSSGEYVFEEKLDVDDDDAAFSAVAVYNDIRSLTAESIKNKEVRGGSPSLNLVYPTKQILKLELKKDPLETESIGIKINDYVTCQDGCSNPMEYEGDRILSIYSKIEIFGGVDTVVYVPIAKNYTHSIQYELLYSGTEVGGWRSISLVGAQSSLTGDTLVQSFEY